MFDQNDPLRFLRLLNLLLRFAKYTIERVDDGVQVRRYLIVPHIPTAFSTTLVYNVNPFDQLEEFVGEILSLRADLLRHSLLEFLADLFSLSDRLRSHDETTSHLLEMLIGNIDDLEFF